MLSFVTNQDDRSSFETASRTTTVFTACPANDRRNRRGTDSSSNRRIGKEAGSRRLKHGDRRFAVHRWKIFQEIFQRGSPFEVVEEALHRDTRSPETKGAAHDLGVATDEGGVHANLHATEFSGWTKPTVAATTRPHGKVLT